MSTPRPDGPRKMARASKRNPDSLMISVEEASWESGFPYTTILGWLHDGLLPYVKIKNKHWIRRAALFTFIDQQEAKGA